MKHVRVIKSTNKAVHVLRDYADYTICKEAIWGGIFDGQPVARVTDVTGPASCGRCSGMLKTELNQRMKGLSLSDLELLAEYLDERDRHNL